MKFPAKLGQLSGDVPPELKANNGDSDAPHCQELSRHILCRASFRYSTFLDNPSELP